VKHYFDFLTLQQNQQENELDTFEWIKLSYPQMRDIRESISVVTRNYYTIFKKSI